ncbi:integrase core domain protein-like protein, partial [Leptotrombidium deliense]
MTLAQFDVKTAFLNGDLDEDIFMEQPYGFTDNTDRVCKLKKSLYGLKQAPRQWNKKFISFIKKFDLEQTLADPCVFRMRSENEELFVAIYVDDGIACSTNKQLLSEMLDFLKTNFEITTTDKLCFLGIEIETDSDSVRIHQTGYASEVLKRFKMQECKPAATPFDPNLSLSNELYDACEEETEFP